MLKLLVIVSICVTALQPARCQTARPNIISIVTDDQAEWSVGAYGNRDSITPNMDRLAREGARFLNAFVCTPVCSPSRAAFLTGRFGTQLGITDYIDAGEAAAGVGLPANALIWPKVLHDHGYATGLIGKWHLGTLPQFHPTKRGFDHFFGFLGGSSAPMDPTLEVEGRETRFTGPLPDILVDGAIRFIDANRAKPFALLIHFREPHLPYGPVPGVDSAPFTHLDPTVPTVKGIDAVQVKAWTRDYYASIHAVDRNLGRLLARLDELELARNTIVLFTSDHGYNIGHHGIHTKGNGFWIAGGVQGPKRPNMFDTSLRVPLIVRWPARVKPGMRIAETVSNIDTFPTILGLVGIPVPNLAMQQGRDFSPALRDEKVDSRDTLFGQYDLHNDGLAYMRMIRADGWKLVRHHHANGLDELYDLKDDPGELKNLYRDPGASGIRDSLQARLTAWMRSVNDPLLQR